MNKTPEPTRVVELNNLEAETLALALFGFCMRQGPPVFNTVENLARKLGVHNQLMKHAGSYFKYSRNLTIGGNKG